MRIMSYKGSAMAHELKTIHVSAETNLASILAAANATPVRLEHGGLVYRLSREADDPWAAYDPDRVIAGMKSAAGHLSREDAERLKASISRARVEGTRLTDRP